MDFESIALFIGIFVVIVCLLILIIAFLGNTGLNPENLAINETRALSYLR